MVNMQVDAPVVGQNPMQFNQPHAHPAQERGPANRVIDTAILNGLPDAGPVVLDGTNPFLVNVVFPTSAVNETWARYQTVGGSVKVAGFFEGRGGGYEVDHRAVHPAPEVEVVALIERVVAKVGFGHKASHGC